MGMARKVSADTPLAEITLRKYEAPRELEERELVKKLCLSLGLLQPGDSRDVIVDILHVMIQQNRPLTSTDIEKLTIENRERYNLPIYGVAPSNIRRQLLRLRDSFLIERVGNDYRFRERETLPQIFEEHVEQYYLKSIISRVKEHTEAVQNLRGRYGANKKE